MNRTRRLRLVLCTLLCFVLCSCQTVLPANEKAQVEELLRAPKLSGDYGAEVGKTLLKYYGSDVKIRARAARIYTRSTNACRPSFPNDIQLLFFRCGPNPNIFPCGVVLYSNNSAARPAHEKALRSLAAPERCGGVKWTRTIDLHDVNVTL